jgi:hypothetical protein
VPCCHLRLTVMAEYRLLIFVTALLLTAFFGFALRLLVGEVPKLLLRLQRREVDFQFVPHSRKRACRKSKVCVK